MARLHLIPHHVRHAVRLLFRSPGTSLLAILALASGIALTATTFSMVHGLLLRPLPFPDGSSYYYVMSSDAKRGLPRFRMSLHDYVDLRDEQSSFETFVAFDYRIVNLSDDEDFPERREGGFATHELFDAPSFEPLLGRVLQAQDDRPGALPVAVIGYDLWQQRFKGDRAVLGRTIRVDGVPTEIVGVMPPGFAFPLRQEIWLPLRLDPSRYERDQGPTVRVFGRLRRGVSPEQARTELELLAGRLAEAYPQTHAGRSAAMVSYTYHFMWPTLRTSLWVLLALVGLGLLIACANVATLLLARAVSRMRELATFTALGASRMQVMTYVLGESLALSLVGGLAGLALATVGVRLVAAQMGTRFRLPFWMEISLDLRVAGVAVLTTVLAAHLAGLYPAIRASRAEMTALLREARAPGLAAGRFVKWLVVGEVGFAFLLLVCTGLFLRTARNLATIDIGADPDRVLTAQLVLNRAEYPEPADRIAFVDELLVGLNAHSGVVSAAAASSLPAVGHGNRRRYALEGAAYASATDYPEAHRVAVTPEFFEIFELPLLRGRHLGAEDRAEAPAVAVVNRRLAEQAWPGEEAVGRRLRFVEGDTAGPWWTVVGVVRSSWPGTLADGDRAGIYVPLAQTGDVSVALAVATDGDTRPLVALLRRETQALDKSLPLFETRTMGDVIEGEMLLSLLFARLTTMLGLVAQLLAAVGIYGVNVFAVNQRTPEIGLRVAMGARRGEIVGLIVKQCLSRIALGLGLGFALTLVVTPRLGWLLFGVGSLDPATFGVTALLLGSVALAACFAPAVRASRISPIESLHYD